MIYQGAVWDNMEYRGASWATLSHVEQRGVTCRGDKVGGGGGGVATPPEFWKGVEHMSTPPDFEMVTFFLMGHMYRLFFRVAEGAYLHT